MSSLIPVSEKLKPHLEILLNQCERIDRISVRAKNVGRFIEKAQKEEDDKPKYTDPINQIQDQIGARIVTNYLSDIDLVSKEVEKYFRPIEMKDIVPESDSEFGYFGKHYIFFLPEDVLSENTRAKCPRFFELQVKTLFQHAWAEAEHDLGYKPSTVLSSDHRRRIAFSAAQAWGADRIFDELFTELLDSKK
jgi:ppGpp synthetase/RelA/SpoT-type nucleotidyltranferase